MQEGTEKQCTHYSIIHCKKHTGLVETNLDVNEQMRPSISEHQSK